MPHVARVGHRSSSFSARPHPPNPDRRTPLCGQTRLARLFPGLLSAVWPESNARAIPTAQGLGLIPQLLWAARFSPDRHFTPHATHPTPHTQPQPQPRPRLTHPASTPGVWYTIRGCLNQPRRSRVDLNLTPTASPLMRSLMAHVCLANGRGSVDVLCLSAHYTHPQTLPPCPSKEPLTLTPHRYGTQAGSRLCYNLGRWPRRASGASKGAPCMHSHRASHRVRPAHRPRARFQ